QAEDGIRDFHVTGVQTCALPICHGRRASLAPDDVRTLLGNKGSAVARAAVVFGREDRGLSNTELALCDLVTSIPLAQPYPSLNRSEERRVGKGGRYRRWGCRVKR